MAATGYNSGYIDHTNFAHEHSLTGLTYQKRSLLFLIFALIHIFHPLYLIPMWESIYRKQQKLRGTKLLRFLWIFDKSRKFFLPISTALLLYSKTMA